MCAHILYESTFEKFSKDSDIFLIDFMFVKCLQRIESIKYINDLRALPILTF